jgi:hypothetical protein
LTSSGSPEDVRGELYACFQTILHRTDATGEIELLERLHDRAVRALGATDTVAFLVECALEEIRSLHRTARESVTAWKDLLVRAERALRPADTTLMSIRSYHAQHVRRLGGHDDLDVGVDLYDREWRLRREHLGEDDYRTRITRANLAVALRDRGRGDDLARGLEMLWSEVRHRSGRYGENDPFTWMACSALARTLVRFAEECGDPAAAESYARQALETAESVVKGRGSRLGRNDAATLRAHLAHAEAQLLVGPREEAIREIRFVRAAARRTGAHLDPGWSEFLLAKAQLDDVPSALRAAEEALRLRAARYPAGSRQVTEVRRLIQRLRSSEPA